MDRPSSRAWAALAVLLAAACPAAAKDFRLLGNHKGGACPLAFFPDGRRLASAGGDGWVRVWDVPAGKELRALKCDASFTCGLDLSPDGKLLASGGYRSGRKGPDPIQLWDTTTWKELPSLAGHQGGPRRVHFTPDGKRIVSVGFDGCLRVWDVAARKQLHEVRGLRSNPTLALTPDGRTVFVGDQAGLRRWDVATGKESPAFADARALAATALAFAPDGKWLVTGHTDGYRLWDTATGKERRRVTLPAEVSGIVFSRDGRTLCTNTYDKFVRVWEMATGLEVRRLEGHTHQFLYRLALSPDGKTLVSAAYDGQVLAWELPELGHAPPGKPSPLTARELEARWDDLGGLDAARAYRAAWELARRPGQALPLLEKRLLALRPPSAPTAARIARLVADLDADDFETREQASAALAKLGRKAETALRQAARSSSLETRRRAEELLRNLGGERLPPEVLSAVRGVQAVEYAGTPEARQVLERLARAAPGTRLAGEAKAAAARLADTTRRGGRR